MAKKDFWFFWGGEFSQWYPSKFEIDDITYNCAEQYMMHQKAKYFNDFESARRIMVESGPKAQKALGRLVANFNADKWQEVCYDIVKKGNIAKFSQNPKLLKVLLSTKDIEIVEASPYDKIWGIGLSANDERAWNKDTWQGTNLLGKAVMDARNELK